MTGGSLLLDGLNCWLNARVAMRSRLENSTRSLFGLGSYGYPGVAVSNDECVSWS